MQNKYIYITNANKTDPSQGHRIKIEKYFETPEQSRAKLPNKTAPNYRTVFRQQKHPGAIYQCDKGLPLTEPSPETASPGTD